MEPKKFVLKASCIDAKGIVAELTTKIFHLGGFITSSDQFSDPDTKQFFLRSTFTLDDLRLDTPDLEVALSPIFRKFQMTYHIRQETNRYRLLILTSKQGHCLADILSRWKRGDLEITIGGIVSNHATLSEMASWYQIPFHHFPMTPNKELQEAKIEKLISDLSIDYIILARYMQILSPSFCKKFHGRIINIHHSFLPSFKGANPYLQAYNRGVKVIGATAHFVTEDLDEGPIIAQETIPVTHAHSPHDLTRFGADIESLVLSKAIKYAIEDRLFIDKHKTIVFK